LARKVMWFLRTALLHATPSRTTDYTQNSALQTVGTLQ
jgi:hypothetical protein